MRIMRSVLMLYLLVSGMRYTQAAEHPMRGLLVFLDSSERSRLGAISKDLIGALSEKAGPILASTSLIQNIFSEYGKDFSDPSYGDIFNGLVGMHPSQKNILLIKLFKNLKNFNSLDKNKYQKEQAAEKYIFLQALNFNQNQWIIKKLSNDVCLFMPITYLHDHNIYVPDAQRDDNSTPEPSEVELRLGLCINHMQTTTIEDLVKTVSQPKDPNYFIKVLYNETLQKSLLFCMRYEYQNRSVPIPAWTIFITGHGGTQIAGLSKQDFKKTLDFLDHKILCTLLVYSSCYSAGKNIEAIYKETGQQLQKTYSFPIIMHALTEAEVYNIIWPIIEIDSKDNLIISSKEGQSFAAFLQAAETMNGNIYYKNIVEHIFKFNDNIEPNETPQIKMPGLEWFSVIDTDNVVAIGQILAQTRSPALPLTIETFFKKDPHLILLYAPNIPFEINLNKSIETIVSMIPGDATHALAKLSSKYLSVNSIIDTFMIIGTLKAHKIFFIKEITGADKTVHNVLIVYNKTPRTASSRAQYLCTAYYTDGKIIYLKKSVEEAPQKASLDQILTYQEYIQGITREPQYIAQATYHKTTDTQSSHITFPGPLPLSKRAIIGTIEAQKNTPLQRIFQAVRNTQQQGAITLVQNIDGTLPNDNIPITVKNVIIDHDLDKIWFTFEDLFYEGKHELSSDYMPQFTTLLRPPPLVEIHEGSLLPITIKTAGLNKIKKFLAKKRSVLTRKRKRDDEHD